MDEIWDLEERFWLAGIDHFQAEMHPDCIMAFPAPVGILSGSRIVASLEGAPRWSSVDIGERHVLRPMPDTVVVADHARATRDASPAYRRMFGTDDCLVHRLERDVWQARNPQL